MLLLDFSDTVIVATGEGLGQGDDALRRRVIVTYFATLIELGMRPQAVAFYTAGVKLVADDSPCLDELRTLSALGVRLIACRTCLDHYGLIDRVEVGEVGNMATIVELQAHAAKVVTI
ncbi:MAG: DsrE family protein [Proteobacteria bacterium]|nr:DsrE family protein [Burkholderiales bacterium]